MISFEKAFDIVMSTAFSMGTEEIHFTGSLDRILSQDIRSDIDMPPFNKSSVDGFACKKEDLGSELTVMETIPAGNVPNCNIGNLQCSRIMTGAIVPSGADCVIMVEETEILPSGKLKFKGSFVKENIARKGEDIKKGDIVIRKGTMIKPQDIAIMAVVGREMVPVSTVPRVAIISSGSELVEPGEFPGPAQIRNSNAYQLMAQAKKAGIPAKYYGIARDNESDTLEIVARALSESDVVIITGGVSMGDFDFIPAVLEKAGAEIRFSRIAIQPGKPTTFGVAPKAVVFGLPGNPVSSFLQFEILVKPFIFKLMNHDWKPLELRMPLKKSFSRKLADRMALIPVAADVQGYIEPVEFHGSAHISSLGEAFGIIAVPVGIKNLNEGDIVSVRQI